MEWELVYEVVNEPYRFESILVSSLLLITGVIFFISSFQTKAEEGRSPLLEKAFTGVFIIIQLVIAAIILPHNHKAYYESKDRYENGDFEVVEGSVVDFFPMKHSGGSNESLTVGEVNFSYSDFDHSVYGFNNTKSHGGPMDEGKLVRIGYYEKSGRNIIIRLEIGKHMKKRSA